MKHLLACATFGILLSCGGSSSSNGVSSSGGTSSSGGSSPVGTPGGAQTAVLDGTWDITSFSDMEDGAMGEMTMIGGHLVVTIPLDLGFQGEFCSKEIHRLRLDVTAANGVVAGEMIRETRWKGTQCGSRQPGVIETVKGVVSGRRVIEKPASLTDLNGLWEVTASLDGKKSETVTVSIDGGTFSGVFGDTSKNFQGTVVGSRATISANRFAFAAQKR